MFRQCCMVSGIKVKRNAFGMTQNQLRHFFSEKLDRQNFCQNSRSCHAYKKHCQPPLVPSTQGIAGGRCVASNSSSFRTGMVLSKWLITLDIMGFFSCWTSPTLTLYIHCLYRGLYYVHGTTTIHLMNVYSYVDTVWCDVYIVVDIGASMYYSDHINYRNEGTGQWWQW